MGEQEHPQMVREALKRNALDRVWLLEVLLPAAKIAKELEKEIPGVLVYCGLPTGKTVYVRPTAAWLKPTLQFLAERGYPSGKPTEYADRRMYWQAGVFQVWLYDSAPGPNCRWVKTGEKSEDVYELVCDEAVKAKAMGLEPVGEA